MTWKHYLSLALTLGLWLGLTAVAVAQPSDSDVVLVTPDQVQTLEAAGPYAIAAAIVALLGRFVGPFAWVLKVARVDQIIERELAGVIDEYLDDHPEIRVHGITVDVKKAWIAQAANRVIAVAPGWLIQFLGGKEVVRNKIRNRLPQVLKEFFDSLFPARPVVAPAPTV